MSWMLYTTSPKVVMSWPLPFFLSWSAGLVVGFQIPVSTFLPLCALLVDFLIRQNMDWKNWCGVQHQARLTLGPFNLQENDVISKILLFST